MAWTPVANKVINFNFPLETSRAPSGQQTWKTPILLHAF